MVLEQRGLFAASYVLKGQLRAGDVTHCFDEETNHLCLPINLVNRLFPVLQHHIGGMARFHVQSCDRTRRRLHDCLLDRVKTSQNGFHLFLPTASISTHPLTVMNGYLLILTGGELSA